jgi:hypothetical protein
MVEVHEERHWLAFAFTVLFGVLGLMASLTVGSRTCFGPLVTLVVIAGLVSIYVFTYVPRLERRDAEELAARRAARAAARAARASSQPPANPATPLELQNAPEGTS